jgi:rhamnose utilization protein RhaD (predicted bifunctional aldolase and dehydrogenase)
MTKIRIKHLKVDDLTFDKARELWIAASKVDVHVMSSMQFAKWALAHLKELNKLNRDRR